MIIGCFAFPIARRVAADCVSTGTRPPPDLNVRACVSRLVSSRLVPSCLVSRTCLLRSALKLYYCLYNILYMFIINGDWWCFLSFYFFCVLYPIDFPISSRAFDRSWVSFSSLLYFSRPAYTEQSTRSACSNAIHCRAPHSPATTAASYLQMYSVSYAVFVSLTSPHHITWSSASSPCDSSTPPVIVV